MQPNILNAVVVVFPGNNCEVETAQALKETGFNTQIITWTSPENFIKSAFGQAHLVVVPGGFSYGDYLRAGAVAARDDLMKHVKAAYQRGAFVLGICNGFQILCEAKLLPGALLPNRQDLYLHRQVECKIEPNAVLQGLAGKILSLQIAHHDGRYTCTDQDWQQLVQNNQIVVRYTSDQNGARDRVAGVCSADGRVLGLMPHPERMFFDWHASQDGREFFQAIKIKVTALFQ